MSTLGGFKRIFGNVLTNYNVKYGLAETIMLFNINLAFYIYNKPTKFQ